MTCDVSTTGSAVSSVGQYSGGGTCPSGHRNFIHPANIGFNTVSDFHPSINVGALDDAINDSYDGFREETYAEMKVSYSNNGPGIDVFAPADETLSAGMSEPFSSSTYFLLSNLVMVAA